MIVSRGKEIDCMKFPRVIFSGRRGECLLYYRATKRKAEKQLLPFAGGDILLVSFGDKIDLIKYFFFNFTLK